MSILTQMREIEMVYNYTYHNEMVNVENLAYWSGPGEQSLVYYFTLESSKVIR